MSTPEGSKIDDPRIIDIADLRSPVLTPLQRQAYEAAEAAPVTFSENEILEAARRETGLSDFGDESFRDRLRVWIKAFDEDESLSQLGRAGLLQMCRRYAVTRLRLEDMINRHPEILDIEIDRPIIVMGLPRSGTTYLVGLLSADSRLRSLPWWEATAPIPTVEDAPTPADQNPRWSRAQAEWEMVKNLLPHMDILHPFDPDHISEDLELQNIDFASYLIEWYAYVPRWRDYYLALDHTGPYAYLKRAMKVLTFLRGSNRWVIKCPAHMEKIAALGDIFPDAIYVMTHRDPVASIQSAFTIRVYGDRLYSRKIDADKHAAYLVDRYKILLERFIRDEHLLPSDRTLHLYYDRWIDDPAATLEAIYRLAEIPLNAQAMTELKEYMDSHRQGKKGKVIFNARRDMKMAPEDIRKQFKGYFERHPVAVEVK